MVELKEKRGRSLNQNSYLHLLLSAFALQYGYTLDEVKTHYYKLVVNKDIFLREWIDKFTGECYKYLRSSADLTKDEMSKSISDFKFWAKEEAGFDFPDSDEYIALLHIKHDIERQQNYIQ